MKFIAVPYCTEQNEPSKPIRKIFEVDDFAELIDQCKQIFTTYVCEDADDAELFWTPCDGVYGDYYFGTDDVGVYFTKID